MAEARVGFAGWLKLLAVTLFALIGGTSAPAQTYRISATVTITNAPVTNGCTITLNADVRTATNDVTLNPAIYWTTNSTKNGAATNLFTHVAQYRFASSINTTYADTNALKFQAAIDGALVISIGGSWASVTYVTQLVSTPFTVPVRVPLSVETGTNATNIANLLMSGLGSYAGTPPITNAQHVLGAVSNATVKPIFAGRSNQFLSFFALEAGTNALFTMTASSLVVNASTAITNLNGLSSGAQWLSGTATGTDFTITTRSGTTGGTNVFDLPFATNAAHGKLRSNDWSAFNLKQPGSALLTNLSATGAHTNAAILLYRAPTNSGIGAPLILKAGTGITLSTNNGTNFLITATNSAQSAIPDFTNIVTRWFIADGHTNLTGIGDYASTNGLANASKFLNPDGTDGSRVQWDGSGTVTWTNGFAGQKLYYSTFNPQIAGRFSVTNSSDNYRAWFGFTDTTFGEMMEGKQPTGLTIAAFRHWDDASTWYAVTSWSGNYEENDTGISHDGASHMFDIRLDASSVVFYIDGVAKMTNSAQIPQFNPTPMRPLLQFRNISDGHDLQAEWVRMKSDR